MDYEFIDLGPAFDDDIPYNQRKEVSVDQHLSSPIRPDILILIEDALKLHPSDMYKEGVSSALISYVQLPNVAVINKNMILKVFDSPTAILEKMTIDASYTYGELFQLGYGDGTYESKWLMTYFPAIQQSIKEYLQSFNPDLLTEFSDEWENLTQLEIRTYTSKMYWEDLKQTMIEKANKNNGTWTLRYTTSRKYPYMIVNKSIGLLMECPNLNIPQGDLNDYKRRLIIASTVKVHVMNYEQILMISDTITSRFFTIYFSRLVNNKFLFKCNPDIIIKIYSIADKHFQFLGNSLYSQLKMFESLCHSIIIHKVDKLEISTTYRDFIQSEIEENDFALLREMTDFLYSLNEYQLVECFGLYRHWGHSFVKEDEGCVKVQKIARNRPLPNNHTVNLIKGCLIRQFCHSYIIKHGRWPNLDVDKLSEESTLKIFIDKSITNINFENTELLLTDWAKIVVRQEFQFDFSADFTALLSDKSISTYKNENATTYDYRMTGIKNRPPRTTTKRVLTEVLNREEIDVKKICTKIMHRDVPENWKIVKLSSKERELNVVPRLFAMMTLEMRLYFCATEDNLSRKIFQYYPQQSMTSSEAKLAHRLQQVGTVTTGCYAEILVGIDFKSWNIHWSYAATAPFFNILDALYGTPGLYTYTHEFFQTSEVSLSSAFRIPDKYFDNSKSRHVFQNVYQWSLHCGGFEGLRQKGWTWITIGLLLLVETITGIKSSIIGQGDNQICKIRIKVPDSQYENVDELISQNIVMIRDKVQLFMKVLAEKSRDIGLEIKPLETWISHKVLVYGKEFLINGAFCSQTLKRISRTMPDVNELYPTIQNKIATMQTSGLTTAQKSFIVAVPYYVCQMESLFTLIRDTERLRTLKWSADINKILSKVITWISTKQALRFIQLLNSDCFGLPFSHIIDYYYRGHPDQLTGYITMLDLISQDKSEMGKMASRLLEWFKQRKYKLGNGSPELLVTNPTSTNVHRVDPVSKHFKKYVKDYIITVCKNRNINNMFNTTATNFDKDLYDYLLKFKPIFPRVLHEIAANTPTGARLAFMSQFSSTRTLQSMTDIRKGKSLGSLMGQSDTELMFHLYHSYNSVMCMTGSYHIDCPTTLAQDIRDYSWQSVTQGRKIEGVTVPHPLHLCDIIHDDALDIKAKEYFSILSTHDISLNSIYTLGSSGMYVGNKTQEKRTGRVLVVENHCKPLESAFRLSQIKTWCINESSKSFDYISYLISLRTSIPETTIQLSGGEIEKGTFYHRLNDHVTKMSSLNNMRHTLTTHFVFSSDNLSFTSRGGEDYNVHMQGLILLSFRLKLIELITKGSVEKYTKLSITKKCCIEEITNDKLVNDEEGPRTANVDTKNTLLYADCSTINELTQPTGVLVKMINKTTPQIAMGSYLLSRLHKIITIQTWTQEENKVIGVSAIGVTELMQTSIVDICKELAYLILIYYESIDLTITHKVMALPSSFWGGIAENALLPDVLTRVLEQLSTDGVVDMYSSQAKISGRLNQLLAKYIKYMILDYNTLGLLRSKKNPTFFLTSGTTMKKIVMMWNCSNLLRGVYNHKNYRLIKDEIKSLPPGNHLSQIDLKKLYISIHGIIGETATLDLINNNPILILKKAPELYFRHKVVVPLGRTTSHMGMYNVPDGIMNNIRFNPYPMQLLFAEELSNFTEITTIDVSLHYNFVEDTYKTLRTRFDHAYRLYDTISTAHSKITQIIVKEQMVINDTCICTADGEASISFAIYKLSGKPIIYNSLYNPDNILPQRYEHFVPGSFLQDREYIKGAKLCLIYGGDLTDDLYMKKFIDFIPSKVPLLTNDAEISGHFHPEVEQKMHLSMLRIIKKSHPTYFIKKSYLHNLKLLSLHLSSYSLYYSSIKIVVPLYSSAEGKEVYIVCQNIKTNLPDPQIYSTNALLVPSNHNAFYEKLCNFAKTRHQDYPFQDSFGKVTANLMKIASIMGFKNNYTESINRFLMQSHTNLNALLINETLEDIEKTLIVTLKNLVESTNASYVGKRVSPYMTTDIAESKKTHKEYDRVAIRYMHIQILKKTIVTSNQKEAFAILMNELLSPISLRYNNDVIYKYAITDTIKWATEYLKHFWKIWGHIHRTQSKIST